jgi:hypothetical protein
MCAPMTTPSPIFVLSCSRMLAISRLRKVKCVCVQPVQRDDGSCQCEWPGDFKPASKCPKCDGSLRVRCVNFDATLFTSDGPLSRRRVFLGHCQGCNLTLPPYPIEGPLQYLLLLSLALTRYTEGVYWFNTSRLYSVNFLMRCREQGTKLLSH